MNFKRIISLTTAMCLAGGIVSAAQPEIDAIKATDAEVFENFQNYSNLKTGTSLENLDGWKLTQSYEGKTCTLEADPNDENNLCLKYNTSEPYTTQALATFAQYDFTPVSDDYILISAKINPSISARWILNVHGDPSKDGTVSSSKNPAIELMIESGGKLACEIRGNTPTWFNINTNGDNWNIGEWNDVDILINSSAMTFDVYTNGFKRNSEPITLSKSYITNKGDRLGNVSAISFGIIRQAASGSLYIDDVSVNGISKERLAEIDKNDITVPQTIESGAKLAAATTLYKLPITWTTDNDAVWVSSDGTVSANASANNQTVTFTAKTGDILIGTYEATVTVNTAVETVFYEPFNYTNGQSISAVGNGWSISAEDTVPSGEGSTAKVMSDPKDSTNSVLDIETLTKAHTADNRYASVTGEFGSDGKKYLMIDKKVNITTDKNRYIFYADGFYKNTSTGDTKSRTMLQFTYAQGDKLCHQNAGGYQTLSENGITLNKWVDMKFIIDCANQSYNVYMDGIKVNSEPVALYSQYSGEILTGIKTLTFGSNRWHNTSGHYYIDDLTVSAFNDNGIVEMDLKNADIPTNTTEDFDLASNGVFGSNFTWESSNSDIISVSGGKASIQIPQNTTSVKLTLTAVYGEAVDTKEFDVVVLGDTDRLNAMNKKLTAYVLSGQKYVSNSFTPNIPEFKAGDILEITSSDAAVSYDSEKNTVNIMQGEDDKIVDVTVKVTSAQGNSFEKTLKLYIPLPAANSMYEDFSYPSLEGVSVSGADSWTVSNEEPDITKTGASLFVQKSPDDETDYVLDTNVIRARDPKLYGNQYATWSGNAQLAGDAIIQTNIKFDNNAKNQYIWYITGNIKTTSAQTSAILIQMFMSRDKGIIQNQQSDGVVTVSDTPLPTGKWFNVKLVLHSSEGSYDLYVDNVKQNAGPISLYSQIDGGVVTEVTKMELGASRYIADPGHMYIDDIAIRSKSADVLETEAKMLTIPDTFIYDVDLPQTGIYEGTTISWESSNPERLSGEGKVNRGFGLGSETVTLTATISSGNAAVKKSFDVKVVKTPYYTTDSLTFETADGNISYVPTSGGKVKTLSLTKYTTSAEDNAAAIVAVYDSSDRLIKISEPISVKESGDLAIDMQLPEKDNMYAKAFVWDMKASAPLAYSYSTKINAGTAIYTIGDSTMQSYATLEKRQQDNNITGWAQVLELGIDKTMLTVDNHAVSGTSTRSFYNQGYIHPVYDSIKEGDYIIIQFGHNDQKPTDDQKAYEKYAPLEKEHMLSNTPAIPEKYKDYKTYEQWLREYAAAARMKGAHVIFATSIYRRQFNGETPINSQCGYPEAMTATAAELNVPVLDLHTRTGEWISNLGYDGSLKYFMAFHGGTDNTHLTYDGAVEIANLAIGEMNRLGLPIAKYTNQVPKR